ncbi:YcxB family protein [Paradevosia shaoguanensis]|uniref:YcxB family protein n=1 Tax=Paradevosia shaoguanensis TaxID=1335043 RepID=UPI0019331B17|nr:YcxB family protein [Paradevosia shaoguanensis]
MATSALPPSVSFTITAEDYANALRLRMRRYWLKSTRIRVFVAAVVVACILAFTIAGFDSVPGSLAIGAMLGLIGLSAWLVIGYFALLPRQARKIYGQQKTMQHPVEASWNSEAYSAATAVASSTVPWGEYHGWSADETMILLMHSPVLFQMIPRHALNAAQAADLTERLKQSGLRNI